MTANAATPLPLRNDTILGICEALGQDFGINANWLRLAFIAPLFWMPMASIGLYLGLGVIVAATRWIAKDELVPVPAANLELVERDVAPAVPATAPDKNLSMAA
ncbi:PspC domain-containing protein [Sphingomonas xanthus]|uniref:PspC domain-containing protein n=1 Tax=Sphingomonas xanthus TaxID=2594473 RepID=A0A516INL9_9SPHN|nr:PspC domain-containing protein [Sphingomonas xanthus]QDP18510.1 PspC domain-containing protein [Sphingomonas xanthus]